MREFMAAMRLFRRPIAVIAIGFVVLQGLLSALAMAQAHAHAISGSFGAGIMCRVDGPSDTGSTSDGTGQPRPCCAVCSLCGPAVEPSWSAASALVLLPACTTVQLAAGDVVVVSLRAIRDGPSQGPPTFLEQT